MEVKSHKKPTKLNAEQWLKSMHPWAGKFNGSSIGVSVSVFNYTQEKKGDGPRLHVHEYDEIFIIRKGVALFKIGDELIEASEGDVLVGPAFIPHKFKNIGDTPLETTDIHMCSEYSQKWVDDPGDIW